MADKYIITGERIQQIADIYLGDTSDFNFNPFISTQYNKHVDIFSIQGEYDNPTKIFCYTHKIKVLSEKIKFFKNKFILITHNSDENIIDNEISKSILKCDKLLKWYSQNVCFQHNKLVSVPIGIANSQWQHGNIQCLNQLTLPINKTENVYFNFCISTNSNKRQPCYDSLKHKLTFLNNIIPSDNLKRLSTYKFCICPEGNGVDTHRLWEALYLKCVPIVLNSPFIRVVKEQYNLPMIILESWDDFDETKLNYDEYTNNLSIDYYKSKINKEINEEINEEICKVNIVLVCANNFQEYILSNIKQLLKLNHKNIYVLTNAHLFARFQDYSDYITLINIDGYNNTSTYINSRKDFWTLTSYRFEYILQFMKQYNVENIIHLENDVVVYYNCNTLLDKFDNQYMYLPFDTYNRNIASIVYIPTCKVLEEIMSHYDYGKNDMENFSIIQKTTGKIEHFPIFIKNDKESDEYQFVTRNYDKFDGLIFDGAAIGQYLGGTDPIHNRPNSIGFINETCIIKMNNYKIEWRLLDGINKPFIMNTNTPIFNLHIHSKNLNKFIDKFAFDIVIPLGPNDIHQIHKQVIHTKNNVIGYRNIYIISYDPNINIDGCITINENMFPFTMKDIQLYLGEHSRCGWYLQQLLKLYAGQVIPGILDRYLVIDSDTHFIKSTSFIKDNKCLYNFGEENHNPYFEHMKKMHSSFEKMSPSMSGICHHMLFETKYIKEIFSMVELLHTNKIFWQVFLECVDKNQMPHAGASEYEIYFNYILKYRANKIIIRPLKWINNSQLINCDYDYISCHSWM